MENTSDFESGYIDLPVRNVKQYYKKLAWFLDRSTIFLRDTNIGHTVILKNLSPGNLKVLVLNPVTGKEYYIHIDNVEPLVK